MGKRRAGVGGGVSEVGCTVTDYGIADFPIKNRHYFPRHASFEHFQLLILDFLQ